MASTVHSLCDETAEQPMERALRDAKGRAVSPLTARDLGLLTLAEAAQIAGFPVATIRVWITRYQLATTRILGEVMVSELEFLDCEKARRNTPEGRARREKLANE
jgi:DNA-directed RNA polymerase specialized sigma24 family protein